MNDFYLVLNSGPGSSQRSLLLENVVEVQAGHYSVGTVLLQCCYSVVTVLLQCRYIVIAVLIHCCSSVVTVVSPEDLVEVQVGH
jgi:hypothetical protein